MVKEFLENEGPALHERLVDYASTRASYIEEWWTESYVSSHNFSQSEVSATHANRNNWKLSHADSVVLSLNPFFILESVFFSF